MPRGERAATTFVALLRAVNVGGHGRLAMADLREICEGLGWRDVQTYVASGNVIFRTTADAAAASVSLEASLAAHMGAPVGVFVRTAREMRDIHARNPFPSAPPEHVYAFFLRSPLENGALTQVKGRAEEELEPGAREIYVRYPLGMGASKLRIPAAAMGTARNMNTVAKLADLAAG